MSGFPEFLRSHGDAIVTGLIGLATGLGITSLRHRRRTKEARKDEEENLPQIIEDMTKGILAEMEDNNRVLRSYDTEVFAKAEVFNDVTAGTDVLSALQRVGYVDEVLGKRLWGEILQKPTIHTRSYLSSGPKLYLIQTRVATGKIHRYYQELQKLQDLYGDYQNLDMFDQSEWSDDSSERIISFCVATREALHLGEKIIADSKDSPTPGGTILQQS